MPWLQPEGNTDLAGEGSDATTGTPSGRKFLPRGLNIIGCSESNERADK